MTKVLENNLEDLFHLSEMTDDEKTILLTDIGGLIMESAILRFLTETDESTSLHFSNMVDSYADKSDLAQILAENFPAFGLILEEEAEVFRKEAREILSSN